MFINKVKYDQVREECIQHGVLCEWLDCDVRKYESMCNIFDFAEKTLGAPIDTFIYCSCYYAEDSLENLSIETIDSNFDVNAKASFLLCQEFYNRFKCDYGRIILMSSMQALEPLIHNIAYGVTKSVIPSIVYTLYAILGEKTLLLMR